MTRTIRPLLLALAVSGPAFGQALPPEGGEIRTGEHEGFSRIVLQVDPRTEWSLETESGTAKVFFPNKPLEFQTGGVFERMPRTRVQGVEASVGPDGTTVSITLACDCRVSTSFVGARYLAIDVADRTPRSAAAKPEAGAAQPETVAEDPAARAEREARSVSAAEKSLMEQIARAADQGLIELASPMPAVTTAPATASETPPAEETPPVPEPTAAEAAPAPEPVAEPAAPALPEAEPTPTPPVAAAPAPEGPATPEDALKGLLQHEQIQATTVFDRDSRLAAARMAEPPLPAQCITDDRLNVGQWSNGTPLFDQVPELNRRVLGEFDAPDPEAVSDLARLYIRYGFGSEAEGLMTGLDSKFDERALLIDLARTVEGRPVLPDGPLSVEAPCPGRHGLWQALGGGAPIYRDEENFRTVQTAFEELPPDLRLLIGPRFVERLLDAGHPEAARRIYDTIARPGVEPTVETRLAEAMLVAAEGRAIEGARAMNELIDENAPNAIDAMIRLTRLTVDSDIPLPDNLVIDLRAAVHENRRSDREPVLRGLLAEALAKSADLSGAIAEIEAARADLPDSGPMYDALTVKLLAAADPGRVGPATYAEVVLEQADRIGTEPVNDEARLAIADRLLALSLPDAALEILEPAAARNEPSAVLASAEARLRLGSTDEALALLANLSGPLASDLRARVYAQMGDFVAAGRELKEAGVASQANYDWASGDWPKVAGSTEDPRRKAMASYMAGRTGAEPPQAAPDPTALTPEQAFDQPLPDLAQPSLESARRLLTTGPSVQGFIQDVLNNPDTATPN